ncbi:hypothetical protein MSAN_02308600 [Mycena sanguinolenta]|uniref:Uncharacterized protein n=1 Tax=Mycena sanguinolenta TaxID=230812 RepID=A0A8H7CHA9_9AGAR|nr:hypothetical protein MSAN_02308600 [Mycena sanguinolenta]
MPCPSLLASALFARRQPLHCCSFLRVTAVLHESKIAYAVFFVLWMAVLGASLTAPVGVRAAHLGPTAQCITTTIPDNLEVSAIVPLINDTAIFLAVSYRILVNTIEADSFIARLRAFVGGTGLSALSRALLQSGQHFYLVAVAANVTLLVLFNLPHLSPLYPAMIAVPAFALINAMACLVFRKIKLGLISSDGISQVPTISFDSDFHATTNSSSLPSHFSRKDSTAAGFGTYTTFPPDDRADARHHNENIKPTNLA